MTFLNKLNKHTRLLRIILGLIIVLLLFYKVGINKIIDVISSMDFSIIIFVLFLKFIIFIIGAINLKILFFPLNKDTPFAPIFKASVLSWAFGLLVPGKLGEFSLVYFLKNRFLIGQSTAVALLDKLITVFVLGLISIIGFFILLDMASAITFVAVFLLGLLGILFIVSSKRIRMFIRTRVLRSHAPIFKGYSRTLSLYLKERKSIFIFNILVTFFKWIVTSFNIFLLFYAFGTSINYGYILIITSMITVISLIPITIGGLGVRESVAVGLYKIIGVSSPIVIGVYVVQLILNYVIASFLLVMIPKKIS